MSEKIRKFIEAARGFLGTPYLHQGRTAAGLDCAGLLIASAEAAGLLEPGDAPPADYGRDPDGRMADLLRRFCRRRAGLEEVQPGDILSIRYADLPQHLMIVEDLTRWGPRVLHALNPHGVIAHRLSEAWLVSHRARLAGVYQIRERAE